MIPLFAVIRVSTKKDSSRSKRRRRDAPPPEHGKTARAGDPIPPQHAKTARAGDPVKRLGLWIPLFLIWLLLLPLVLVLLPMAVLALLILRVNPFRAFVALWTTLTGLTGTHIEVNGPNALVYVRIF